ncbi:MAG: hypothetical protein ABIO99_09055 [Candidatus Limnocylindria bacterium]
MRGIPSLMAAALAGVAAIVANQDGDPDIVPFFVALTIAAGIHAWALARPPTRLPHSVASGIAGLWTIASLWIGVLLLMFQATCACSRAEPLPPELTYLGLTATVYHLVGLYGGLGLVLYGTSRVRRDIGHAQAGG